MKPQVPDATPLYPTPSGLTSPLCVVLVAPPRLPGWVRGFIQLAANNDWIEVVLLTTPEAVLPTVPAVGIVVRTLLAFERVVHRRVNSCLTPEPAPRTGEHDSGGSATLMPLAARVAALRPDLVLLLGPRAWATELAGYAPKGCWIVDASLVDPGYAGLALLDPMLRQDGATQTQLVLETSGGMETALAGSWGRTRTASFKMQREDAFRKLPTLLLLSLHRLAAGRDLTAGRSVATLRLQAPQIARDFALGLRALESTLRATARSLAGRLRRGRGWLLVLRQGGAALDPSAAIIGPHALLKAPKGWWADPCVVEADVRKLLFVEEMADPQTCRASIACIELVDGGARRLGVVLDEPGHLSFPQVFRWQEQWYLTVESGYARRVSLYQATDFPLKWTRLRDLIIDRVCVDPILHHQEGHWYLFVNAAEYGSSTCDDLYLFHADSLEGPFRPHPASPILGDARRARMAGRLFHHRGRLIRPAQDCTPSYGKALVFNEVLELSPTAYRERALSRLAADWAPTLDGCHTYSIDGGMEVLDALGRPPPGAVYMRLLADPEPGSSIDRSGSADHLAAAMGAVVESANIGRVRIPRQ